MNSPSSAIAYARAHRPRFLSELKDFVRIPSVSAQPQHSGELKKCAEWLAAELKRIGMEGLQIVPTAGGPIVYCQWLHAPGRPTVLIYGHYDVQPADPVSDWQTPPFEPSVIDGHLHGRGASDDKGQLFTQVKAIESYLRGGGGLPVNVKCLFEGEEEIGSPGLFGFVMRNRHALAPDFAVMSDTRMLGPDRPTLTYSLRGQLALELEIAGPRHDVHSGNFGGAIHNPLQALCEIIAQLHDRNGRVAIPGFYDGVFAPGQNELDYMQLVGPSGREILNSAEAKTDWGEREYSLYERVTIRPALTLNGISGGYQGVGGKGVIPSRALAKLSFRLVPDQDPREVGRLFRSHIARITPPSVNSVVRIHSSANPAMIDRRHPALRAAGDAYRKGFGRMPIFLRSGGSIPAVSIFQRVLGKPTVLMGYALPGDRIHAPNEKFSLSNFYRGIETNIWFMTGVRKMDKRVPRFRRRSALPSQPAEFPQNAGL